MDLTIELADAIADTDNVALKIASGLALKYEDDQIHGNSTSPVEYLETAASSAGDFAVEFVATTEVAGAANPAAPAYYSIELMLKGNSMLEKCFLREYQQNKSIGNGSLYIYN